jgi:hypothetical protein
MATHPPPRQCHHLGGRQLFEPFAAICDRLPQIRQIRALTASRYTTHLPHCLRPPAAHNCLSNCDCANPPHGEFPDYISAFFLAQIGLFSLPPFPRFAKTGRQHTAMVFDMVCPSPPCLDTPHNPNQATSTPRPCPSAGRLSAHAPSSTLTHRPSSLALEGITTRSFPSEFLTYITRPVADGGGSDVPLPPHHHH